MASPRPRPESSVIIGLVDTPDWKISDTTSWLAQPRRLVLRQHAELQRGGLHIRRVDARPVVGDHAQLDPVARPAGREGDANRPAPRLLLSLPLRRSFDAVVDAVSHQMYRADLSSPLKSAGQPRSRRRRITKRHLFATITRQVRGPVSGSPPTATRTAASRPFCISSRRCRPPFCPSVR